MQVFLVGGAVRDGLLNQPVHDKDFVVVGADFNDLLCQGFSQVGADFPVFLHPHTHHEYALARTERKTGKTHTDFSVHFDKNVTLKDDLQRRDLTINALAIEVKNLFDDTPISGQVIDFYGGMNDLHHKILRHVSPAFSEDPLRILRVARFFARFKEFSIADETKNLMIYMAKQGDLSHLSKERLWAESAKAMQYQSGFLYWELLANLQILAGFLPDLANLWQDKLVRQQTFLALSKVTKDNYYLSLSEDKRLSVQFSLLVSGFRQKDLITTTAKAICAPKNCMYLSYLLFDFKEVFQKKPAANDIINLIERTKAHQEIKPKQTNETAVIFQLICSMDNYYQAHQIQPIYCVNQIKDLLYQAIICYQSTTIAEIDKNLTGADIGKALKNVRLTKIHQLLNQ